VRRLIPVLVVTLVAVACSSATEGGTSNAPSAEVTTTTGADATAPSVPDSASCVGVWELDSEAFFEMYNEIASAADQIAFVDGAYVVTWNAGGTFTDERVDWSF